MSLALGIALIYASTITASPALAAGHVFVATFGAAASNPANPYPLSNPTGVAVDNSSGPSARRFYVTDPANHRVEKFDSEGHFLLMFGIEVNETKVLAAAPAAEQNVCAAGTGDICKAGAPTSSPGGFQKPTDIAVDSSSPVGDLYVLDTGDGYISKFDSSGSLIAAWGTAGQLDTVRPGFGGALGIAVDPSGSLFVAGFQQMSSYAPAGTLLSTFFAPFYEPGLAVDAEGNLYGLEGQRNVVKASAAGATLAEPLDAGPAVGLAVDPTTNDLYVDDGSFSGGLFINRFALNCGEECTPLETFGNGDLSSAAGLSIDAVSGEVYVADAAAGHVAVFESLAPSPTTGPASGVAETTAALAGHLDLAGHGEVTECYFEYGTNNTYNFGRLPCAQAPPFATSEDVTATLTALQPKTTYHFRLVAANANATGYGRDNILSTQGSPSIDGLSSSDLQSTTGTLQATINPNGVDTTFFFEYGTTPAYGQSTPLQDVGSDPTDHSLAAPLTGLQAGFTYHFRVVAENADGRVASRDQTFGFFPSSCPNQTVRQQTGAVGLPDCRAYEIASAENAGNSIVFPSAGPNTGRATGPSRLAYTVWGGVVPGGGEADNTYGDLYLATRTPTGWVSRYIGLPGNQAYLMGGPPWTLDDHEGVFDSLGLFEPDKWQLGTLANPDMSKILDWYDGEYQTTGVGASTQEPAFSSNAPYLWDATTGEGLERWPSHLELISGGEAFKGQTAASADLTHFVFSSNVRFAHGGLPGDVYDDNTQTGEISVASLAPDGKTHLALRPLEVSEDGSHILMTTGLGHCPGVLQHEPSCGRGRLYMRIGDASTYEIAPGEEVEYLGMSAGGSRVYFTSTEALTAEDTDTSADLYMWSAQKAEKAEAPLTLLSLGDQGPAGPGNSDSCSASWTAKCGVVPISFATYSTLQGGLGGNGTSDTYLASANGDIYFYSPERLDAGKGAPGEENLYVYRNARPQFVTSLSPGHVCTLDQGSRICSDGPVARMDVSPDDAHMALITASRVTSYNNRGFSEMYSYDPATGEIVCDSCVPDGAPPNSDVFGAQNGLFMTDDGRAFFSTEQALVSQDTNQSEDVYEFVEGRPQLITKGTGAGFHNTFGIFGIEAQPGLDGVSADGTDVFFATYEHLVGQDRNGQALKIYDARSGGGFPFLIPAPGCVAADECHGEGSSAPAPPANGTGAALGSRGNIHRPSARQHKRHRRHPKKRHPGRGRSHPNG